MPRLFLVRHARPSARWGQDPDPGIDPAGVEQARIAASELAALLSPATLLSSPLRRCRETAMPLEQMWQRAAKIFPAVTEIPAPPLEAAARREWLTRGMLGTWSELQASSPAGSPDYLAWRGQLLDSLQSIETDAVIYSHYIAINAVVAATKGVEHVVCFRPDHASITVVETKGGDFRLLSMGREAETGVLTR